MGGRGSLAGLLHDLGKYADRFQARLRGEDSGLDHWSQGAWLALFRTSCQSGGAGYPGTSRWFAAWRRAFFERAESCRLAARTTDGRELSDPDPDKLERRALWPMA